MKIYNEQDEEITQEEVDPTLGHLVTDYRLVEKHDAVPPQPEEGHNRIIVEFDDGSYLEFDNGYDSKYFDEDRNFHWPEDEEEEKGDADDPDAEPVPKPNVKEIREEYVVDKPYVPGVEEWFENEEILRYVLYTPEELEAIETAKKQQEAAQKYEAEQNAKFKEMYEALEAVKQAFPDYAPPTDKEE